jgi:hypothetical protein
VNLIVWDNSASAAPHGLEGCSVTYSDLQTGDNPTGAGTGNISDNPAFANPAADNFHINPGSPCEDTGDPSNHPADDFEGDLRSDGQPDMGADEI